MRGATPDGDAKADKALIALGGSVACPDCGLGFRDRRGIPPHRGGSRCKAFARAAELEADGWIRASGRPHGVGSVMARFQVEARREPTGTNRKKHARVKTVREVWIRPGNPQERDALVKALEALGGT